jgi:hypothetical protein
MTDEGCSTLLHLRQKDGEVRRAADAEIATRVQDNHMWINAFAAINPTDDLKRDIGEWVLTKLEETDMRDGLGISKYVVLGVNKS